MIFNMKNDNERFKIFILCSILLHVIIFLLFNFGLPSLFRSQVEPPVVTFEILPVDAISNIKTQKRQAEEEVVNELAKKVHNSSNDIPEPQKDSEKSEETQKESKRDFDEKKSEVNREVVSIKSTPKTQDKKTDVKSNKAQTKQTKVDKKKPVKKKLPTDKEMDDLLKTLEKASEGKEEKSNKRATGAKSDATEESLGGEYNENLPLSITEKQAIRQQVESNWGVVAGGLDAHNIIIKLSITLAIDGTVEDVRMVDINCTSDASICRAASDSAIRAVWKSSPIKNLSPERYNIWQKIELFFNPSEILG